MLVCRYSPPRVFNQEARLWIPPYGQDGPYGIRGMPDRVFHKLGKHLLQQDPVPEDRHGLLASWRTDTFLCFPSV